MRRSFLTLVVGLLCGVSWSQAASAVETVGLDEYRSLCHETTGFDEYLARATAQGWSSAGQEVAPILDNLVVKTPVRTAYLKKSAAGGGIVLARITEGKPRDVLARKQVGCFVRIIVPELRPDLRQGFHNLMGRPPKESGTGKGGTVDYWMSVTRMRAHMFWNEPMDDGRHIMTFLVVDM